MVRSTPLQAVYTFTLCARTGSFKQAAEQLYITAGAVSRQIQTLEQHLGFALFERQFRKVELTAAGQLFFSQVYPALRSIDAAVAAGRAQAARTPLGVEATPTLAMHWLIPRLAAFQRLYPHIDLQLSTGSGVIQPRVGCDLYLRRDPAQFAGLPGQSFMVERSVLVCSPALLRQHPALAADQLQHYPLVMMRSRPDLWRTWFAQQGQEGVPARQTLVMDNTILAIQAVLEGLGVGLIPTLFIQDYLASGVLVRVPGAEALQSGSYSVLQGDAAADPARALFVRWIEAQAAQLD